MNDSRILMEYLLSVDITKNVTSSLYSANNFYTFKDHQLFAHLKPYKLATDYTIFSCDLRNKINTTISFWSHRPNLL